MAMRTSGTKLFVTLERQFATTAPKSKIPKESVIKAVRTKDYPKMDKTLKSNLHLKIGAGILGLTGTFIGYECYEMNKNKQAINLENFGNQISGEYHTIVDPLIYDIKNELFPDKTCRLPDQYVEDGQTPLRTIVIRLEDGLVGEYFSNQTGIRYYKRRGIDHFIGALATSYEIVIVCKNDIDSQVLVSKVDSNHIIAQQLYEGNWKKEKGIPVRSIQSINRDPKRTIIIDYDENYFEDKENTLVIPDINKVNAKEDPTLDNIIPVLLDICEKNVDDVRTYIQEVGGSHNYMEGYNKKLEAIRAQREQQRLQYLMPSTRITAPAPELPAYKGDASQLTSDELRFGNPVLSCPTMYGFQPQVIRNKTTGNFEFNKNLNSFPDELTEDQMQEYIPEPEIDNKEFDVKKNPTVWQRIRLETKKREQDRLAHMKALLAAHQAM